MATVDFRIIDGVIYAPVSEVFTDYIQETMTSDITLYNHQSYKVIMRLLRDSVKSNRLLKLTTKKFRAEVDYMLSVPFEDMYQDVYGVPYSPPLPANIVPFPRNRIYKEPAPKLMLVKE